MLAVVLLPALAATKPDSRSFQCLENQRQLVRAWQMYAEDNNDLLPPNDYPWTTSFVINDYVDNNPTWGSQHRNWVVGSMHPTCSLDQGDALAAINGKSMYSDPNTVLSPYQTNRAVYHCPADNFTSAISPRGHTRSYSMNSAVGTIFGSSIQMPGGTDPHPIGSPVGGGWLPGSSYNGNQTAWLTYGKMSSFSRPGPANTFVIMDELPYGINDASIAIPAFATPGQTYLIDLPSNYHNGAAAISFADGHVIIHKWQDARTYTPAIAQGGHGSIGSGGLQTPDDPDCFYLASITSARR